jgi:hypothetical protein
MSDTLNAQDTPHCHTSVVLCTYNGSQFLNDQLQSISTQSVPPSEIIVSDDASTDETRQIVRAFALRSKVNVRIIFNQANLGYTKNFEKAAAFSNGNIIFFSDQDDVWHSNKIQSVCQLFDHHPSILGVTHDGRLVDQHLNWHGTTKQQQIISGYGKSHRTITGCLSAIRRCCLDLFLPIPYGIAGHDTWLSYIFSKFPERWLYSTLCLQDLRRHHSNTSQWVVNSFKPVSKLSIVRSQLSSPIAADYADRREMNRCLTDRLGSLDGLKDFLSSNDVADARTLLSNELLAINRREGIAKMTSKSRRLLAGLELWRGGGYKYFNGTKSFIRDLLR